MKKKKFKVDVPEICYNLVNALIAGSLVFLGSFTSGNITKEAVLISLVTALIVAITSFRNYWAKEEKEYTNKLFKFV